MIPCADFGRFSLAGCATQDPVARASGEVFDPYERTNRTIHAFNRGVDRLAFRPASKSYVAIVPAPMVTSFSYFAENLSMPGQMVNALLQGDLKERPATRFRAL